MCHNPIEYRYRDSRTYIYTYMYIPADINSYIQTYRRYIHKYIHSYTQTYIHAYTHTYTQKHTYIHTYVHTYIHTYIHTYNPHMPSRTVPPFCLLAIAILLVSRYPLCVCCSLLLTCHTSLCQSSQLTRASEPLSSGVILPTAPFTSRPALSPLRR